MLYCPKSQICIFHGSTEITESRLGDMTAQKIHDKTHYQLQVTEQSKNQRRFIVRTGIGFLPLPTGKCTVTCINSCEQNDPTHKIVNTEQHGFHKVSIVGQT
jgi:hypothetical protein